MKIVRTSDSNIIKSVLCDSTVYKNAIDDFCVNAEDFEPVIHDSVYWLVLLDDDKPIGLYSFHPINTILYSCHVSLLPEAYGNDNGGKALEWMRENTPCKKFIVMIPEYNRLAIAYAKRNGFVTSGMIENSVARHGKLHNQVILGA